MTESDLEVKLYSKFKKESLGYMKTFENIINNLWSIQNPCYGWLKHKYSLVTNISKSHLKYQDLPLRN